MYYLKNLLRKKVKVTGQIETIKNAILDYGPVSTHIYGNDTGFLHYKGGVYEYWGSEAVDHSLELIGWNDTLPHSHGTGAWLVKNSWGTDWGASGPYPGCAWVAYGAANIGEFTNAIASYKDPDDVIFYHDECGCLGYYYGGWGPTAYGAVRFTPSQDLTLTAVDFWTGYSNMEYEITIFDIFNADSSGYSFTDPLGTTQAGTIDELGYYSILLDTPVPLVNGDDFIVQVKFTAPGNDYPVPIDYYNSSKLPAWSEIATFSGESYCSETGTLFGSTTPYDIGIRARAEERSATPAITSSSPLPAVNDIEGATRTFSISIDQEVNVTWLLNEVVVQKNTSVTSASYTNTSAGVGTWNVSAIGTNADWTDMRVWTWNVTEKPVPIAAFTYSPQNQVANQPITFNASNSTDTAKTIASYDWNFGDGVTGTAKIVSHSYSSAGNYSVTLTVTDKADLTNSTSKTVSVNPVSPTAVFDTKPGSYPCISGTYKGTITPKQTLTVQKLYTYPCAGTDGHTKYIRIYNSTDTLSEGHWCGYREGDHNISLSTEITLLKDHEYNYTIVTGSYPQIHHTDRLEIAAGVITCSEFIDINGNRYNDWIPAIMLFL